MVPSSISRRRDKFGFVLSRTTPVISIGIDPRGSMRTVSRARLWLSRRERVVAGSKSLGVCTSPGNRPGLPLTPPVKGDSWDGHEGGRAIVSRSRPGQAIVNWPGLPQVVEEYFAAAVAGEVKDAGPAELATRGKGFGAAIWSVNHASPSVPAIRMDCSRCSGATGPILPLDTVVLVPIAAPEPAAAPGFASWEC